MDFIPAPSICLSMIVKNEAHVLRRCLESVRPYIQRWAICDTGSTDGTQQLIMDVLGDLPGVLREDDWVDFGANRTAALQLAAEQHCAYTLVIDADETLVVEDPMVLTTLTEDAYRIDMHHADGLHWPRVNLLRSALNWRYKGIIHEYAEADPPVDEHMLYGLYMWTDGGGARGLDAEKARRDLAVMERSVLEEPENARYWFYLAQGYEVCRQIGNALGAYAHRITMGGNTDEVWYSQLRSAQLHAIGERWDLAQLCYIEAYNTDPTRCEPLYWLALGYSKRDHDPLAMVLLEKVALLPKPFGVMMLENEVWDSMRWVLYATVAHNVGDHEAAQEIAARLLKSGRCPEAHRELITRLAEPAAPEPATVAP